MPEQQFILVIICCLCCIFAIRSEYISNDEPNCREDCFNLNETLKEDCLKEVMEFYSYKLIKSVFNYGKTAIYAGLWNTRYEDPDPTLFFRVLENKVQDYKKENLLGDMSYDDLESITHSIFKSLQNYTVKHTADSKYSIPYASIPSLQCPVLCSYDLATWKTLFFISLSIFILALITISLYTIFLRKQYLSLKTRSKNIKYTKVANSTTDST